jgi:hypothetical protein
MLNITLTEREVMVLVMALEAQKRIELKEKAYGHEIIVRELIDLRNKLRAA